MMSTLNLPLSDSSKFLLRGDTWLMRLSPFHEVQSGWYWLESTVNDEDGSQNLMVSCRLRNGSLDFDGETQP